MEFATTYIGVLIALVATGFGFPVPEEIILVLAGAAAYQGLFEPRLLIMLGVFGVLLGDTWVYFVGRHWGRRLLRHRSVRLILTPSKIEKAERQFLVHSAWAIFTVRFFFGLKAPAFFTAGLLRLSFVRFLLADTAASLIHVPLYLTTGYLFSPHVEKVVVFIKSVDRWAAVTVILAAILLAAYIGYVLGFRRKAAPQGGSDVGGESGEDEGRGR